MFNLNPWAEKEIRPVVQCINLLCRLNTNNECHADDDIDLVCSLELYRDECKVRKDFEKVYARFDKFVSTFTS